jgi:cytochrome c oxidase subunit 3
MSTLATRLTEPRINPAKIGIWVLLAVIAMLFAAFSSAYLVRMTSTDWRPVALPSVLWLNTLILIASSVSLELGRRAGGVLQGRWLNLSLFLGLLFLAGQVAAWRQLVDAGILVPTSPHSSFLFILTGLHGLHLIGGLAFMLSAKLGLGGGETSTAADRLGLCATYWHFMGGLWVYLFAVLHLG